jgi:hypothetical protein
MCGTELIGLVISKLRKGFPNAVNNKGAVSPATLASESITPVIIPFSAAGNITLKIVA